VVESINYTGGPEITSLDQEQTKLTYSLTVSAFYMPTLADLQAQLPHIDAPAPANKKNPLSQFTDTTNSN
jgi:type IV pilus assembly protein PilO